MSSAIRAVAVFAILFTAITTSVSATPHQANQDAAIAKEHRMGLRLNEKGIPNFGKVTPTLYRSAQPSRAGFEALAKMGVQIIVDAHGPSEKEKKEADRLGMQYVAIPWHCPWPKDEPIARFLKLLRENSGKKVLVHCRLGDDRTGMMVAAYRMSEEGWTAQEAMKEMQTFGFTTIHHAMCPSLAGYEASFPQRLKTNPAFEDLRK
jgi:protein tyrosine phosphatase (PTP) superfamily phosphohydrolase (DUF442 family)